MVEVVLPITIVGGGARGNPSSRNVIEMIIKLIPTQSSGNARYVGQDGVLTLTETEEGGGAVYYGGFGGTTHSGADASGRF